jgi:hypothetical protein
MLQMRPSCECCDREQAPDSTDALICNLNVLLDRQIETYGASNEMQKLAEVRGRRDLHGAWQRWTR